ncbi:MAG: FHA domain-containing protein [Actinomycetota bacterium]|nr:FHA domain-containing protein [Actinomycetota bacterium]
MSDAQLNVLNYALLALIYVFFARVLWAVWSEVRGPRPGVQAAQTAGNARNDTTATAGRPGAGMPMGAPVVVVPPKAPRKRGIPQRLVVLQPKVRKGAAYPIGNEITLGRAVTCAIGIPDDTFASQLHARVFRRDGEVWVEDLGSTNGTHLNGGRLSSAQMLSVGDRVQIGSTIFEAQ